MVEFVERETKRLRAIWDQKATPVVLRRGGKGERLRLRLPYANNNWTWLRNGRRCKPIWNAGEECWEIPKAWFNDFVERALKHYGALHVIQPYREQEICAAACRNAKGHECQCSCMGEHHGMGEGDGWFDVTEAFAVRSGERMLACRTMIKK
ncbi:MAG: hypothetical protein AAFR02_01070 [Pseudomonadota bacterium]